MIVPKQNPDAAQPANDVTYLDDICRITRGGDDSLFIFRREASAKPMLSMEERAALYAEGGESTVTGDGVAAKGAPPEVSETLVRRVGRRRRTALACSAAPIALTPGRFVSPLRQLRALLREQRTDRVEPIASSTVVTPTK